jgi:hypothetical protein
MPDDDEINIVLPLPSQATFPPPLRGVSTEAASSGVVGYNQPRDAVGLLGTRDRVFGQSTGVYGQSSQQGVFGRSTTATGTGVYGNSEGAGFGVRGESTEGVAVQGQSFGSGIAVQGIGGRLAGRFEGPVEIVGDVRLTGSMEVSGDIRFTGSLADCAEEFEVAAPDGVQAEPGSVLVIDDDGVLVPCRAAYDRRAAGVVSGAGAYKPGLVLDRRAPSPDRQAIALVGKVFCKVDARLGAIAVGDLLTTSDTPGHAMKASDPLRTPGAVIGKALRGLEGGTGLIPILVALQ